MTLVGIYGEVDNIYCEVADLEVVGRKDDGQQAMTGDGFHTTLTPAEGIPAECPLLIDPDECFGGSARNLGQFAICMDCPHSISEQDGMTVC